MYRLSETAQELLKNKGDRKIVFTNGCFDILHVGHIAYLNEAKKYGDLLVLGLNSDASVKRLKGENRPVNPESDRSFMLENLKAVDLVEIFEEDTPLELIKALSPDVLVKGGDWKPDQIVGSDLVLANGGEVRSLLFKDGYSTTNLIKDLQGRE
jgi:rfaE bifunctional protein nucleotidyltransferase chain/domain